MYAIVKTGGKQYTVKPGDVFDVEKLPGEAGDKVNLEVLLLNDGKNVITDVDALAKTEVTAEIVDQHKGDKVLVFKFKKRKGYKRLRGHRQQLTRIAITQLGGESAPVAKKAAAPKKVEVKEAAPEATAPKTAAKQEAASEDLSKLTVAQLKDVAKEKGLNVPSSARKADIITIIEDAGK